MDDINRERIIKAAYHLFNTRGYRSVTVQDLAEEVGMSKKTIYQYFDGKEEIAKAVVEETINRINQIKDNPDLEELNPLIALREILLQARNGSLRFGALFLMDMQKFLPDLAAKYKQFREEGKQTVEHLLKKAQEMGLLKDIPINLVMEILHESLNSLTKPEFLSQHSYSMQEVTTIFIDIFFSGIALPNTSE